MEPLDCPRHRRRRGREASWDYDLVTSMTIDVFVARPNLGTSRKPISVLFYQDHGSRKTNEIFTVFNLFHLYYKLCRLHAGVLLN